VSQWPRFDVGDVVGDCYLLSLSLVMTIAFDEKREQKFPVVVVVVGDGGGGDAWECWCEVVQMRLLWLLVKTLLLHHQASSCCHCSLLLECLVCLCSVMMTNDETVVLVVVVAVGYLLLGTFCAKYKYGGCSWPFRFF